ncbi:MAG: class I SAM-dependent methyltransferase [Treponema sp.]|jgi:2-polyprenyl-3-methyl-5-hydroxy-6-metoxy-1,4-benzoquinol methylase|nr:class I SAM-dependent methyltransferase [Treponema sp.]
MSEAVKTWSTPVSAQESRRIPCVLCGGEVFKPALACEGFSYVRCARCGLIQMNPQPLLREVRFRYREGHGENYLAYEIANEPAFLDLQERSLHDAGFYRLEESLFSQAEAPAVLDIGCATGALLETLAKRGWKTTGVELSVPQADYARRFRGLDVRPQSLEECRFTGGSFQAALASHLVEHVNDPASLIREVRRILAAGGVFFITTPNSAGFQARLFRGRWRSAIFDHLYLFSVKTLRALLEQNGFSIEKIITWGGLGAGIAPAFIKKQADRWAKRLGAGDVMMIRARKSNG